MEAVTLLWVLGSGNMSIHCPLQGAKAMETHLYQVTL